MPSKVECYRFQPKLNIHIFKIEWNYILLKIYMIFININTSLRLKAYYDVIQNGRQRKSRKI